MSLWVGIGSQIYPPSFEMTKPLPLTTEGCNFTTAGFHNWTATALPTESIHITTALGQNTNSRYVCFIDCHTSEFFFHASYCMKTVSVATSSQLVLLYPRPMLADKWYSLSYLYFSPIGTITAVCVGVIVSLFSGKGHHDNDMIVNK